MVKIMRLQGCIEALEQDKEIQDIKNDMINTIMTSQNDHHQDRTTQASTDEDVLATIMHYLLVQYNLQQGLKVFGEQG